MSDLSIARVLADHRGVDNIGACTCGKTVSTYGTSERDKSEAHRRHLEGILSDRLRVDQRAAVEETCSCGATFHVDTWHGAALEAVGEWRQGHKHAESVGICGDRPQPLMIGGVEVGRPHCELKAGHDGMHSDGEGHWRHADTTEDAP